jgi:hypothetical protein
VQRGRTINTVKGYVTAIAERHELIDGLSLGLHRLVIKWVRGLTQFRPASCPVLPTWRLQFVLKALTRAPFEPLKEADLKYVTLKTAFLVALTSARRVSELQALGHSEPYTVFRAQSVTLATDVDFIPTVNTAFHTSQLINLPALHTDPDPKLRSLCV